MVPNTGKPLYLTVNKINGCIEESNRNKYLTLVSTGENKDLTRSTNKNPDDCDEKYVKIKFNSDEDLLLKRY